MKEKAEIVKKTMYWKYQTEFRRSEKAAAAKKAVSSFAPGMAAISMKAYDESLSNAASSTM